MTNDAIVIGGSYAGMSAALQLLRARRRVTIIDGGKRRNRFAAHSHGFLTRDGEDPAQIAAVAREQLTAYPTLNWIDGEAVAAEKAGDVFRVNLADGRVEEGKRLVLATGMTDQLPEVEGIAERWGKSVFHCPYCHGYELGGERVGIVASMPMSAHQAILLSEWGPVTHLTRGMFEPSAEDMERLEARGVTIERTPIARLVGEADVELVDGRVLSFAGLFTASRVTPSSPIAQMLGCEMDESPMGVNVRVEMAQTSVPGVFAAGDVARAAGSVAIAVGDGAMAGAMTHRSLIFG